jgi:hypothetical protein
MLCIDGRAVRFFSAHQDAPSPEAVLNYSKKEIPINHNIL